jgi:hypothetical protein
MGWPTSAGVGVAFYAGIVMAALYTHLGISNVHPLFLLQSFFA